MHSCSRKYERHFEDSNSKNEKNKGVFVVPVMQREIILYSGVFNAKPSTTKNTNEFVILDIKNRKKTVREHITLTTKCVC